MVEEVCPPTAEVLSVTRAIVERDELGVNVEFDSVGKGCPLNDTGDVSKDEVTAVEPVALTILRVVPSWVELKLAIVGRVLDWSEVAELEV